MRTYTPSKHYLLLSQDVQGRNENASFFLEGAEEYPRILLLMRESEIYPFVISIEQYLLQDKMEKYLSFSSMYIWGANQMFTYQICTRANIYWVQILTYCLKFLHSEDILYLPLFSGFGYECRITLAAILFFFFSPTFFFKLPIPGCLPKGIWMFSKKENA